MDFILIAIVIVSLYLAISLVGFSRVTASLTAPFDTRFVRPVKFINNPNLSYEIEVEPPETSLAMMRGVDPENPGNDDIQIGDLVKVSTRTYEPMLCGQETAANAIEYYGRVVGSDGEKAKIQWTYYKVNDGANQCPSGTVAGCAKSADCCAGKEHCHLSKADKSKGEVKRLFGTSNMSCSDCPVSSKVLLDKLERVPEIPAPGYVSGDWLNEISPSSDLVEQDESSQTEYGLF
jgi:hypothetical protein